MPNFLPLETEIVGLLQAGLPANVITYAQGVNWFDIEGRPLRTSNFWVLFSGLDRNVSKSLSSVSQSTAKFDIALAVVNLRTHQAVYPLIASAIVSLHGKVSQVLTGNAKFNVNSVSALEYDKPSSAWKLTLSVTIDFVETLNACL